MSLAPLSMARQMIRWREADDGRLADDGFERRRVAFHGITLPVDEGGCRLHPLLKGLGEQPAVRCLGDLAATVGPVPRRLCEVLLVMLGQAAHSAASSLTSGMIRVPASDSSALTVQPSVGLILNADMDRIELHLRGEHEQAAGHVGRD